MKILLAPDKFRGSLTAPQVCQAMAEGIAMVSPAIEVVSLPMADGGEGTLDILLWHSGGEKKTVKIHDPLGRLIAADFGISGDKTTAFIEMATASGLPLLTKEERNPLITSTLGTGEIIQEALKLGVKKIILGIGGSATTDAGMGMASAFGWQFLDKEGNRIEPNGGNLSLISVIQPPKNNLYKDVTVEVACDVTNPLYGPNGAAFVYGSQKGADEQAIRQLDEGLEHLSTLIQKNFGVDLAMVKGAGAAGGLGYGALFFLQAQLKEGVKLLMDYCDFDRHLTNVDLIITGEGKIDAQTLQGKLVKGITDKANEKHIPVTAICGTLDASPEQLRELGVAYATSILQRPMNLEEAMTVAYQGVREAVFYLVNLWTNKK